MFVTKAHKMCFKDFKAQTFDFVYFKIYVIVQNGFSNVPRNNGF